MMKTPIQTLAGRFGLSQQQLAVFLSVDRSMINHVMSGRKRLPSHRFLQLTQLLALDKQENNSHKMAQPLMHTSVQVACEEEIGIIINDLQIQIQLAEKQLQQIEQQRDQCTKNERFIQLMQEQEIPLTDKQQRLLSEMQYQHHKLREKCSDVKQTLLSLHLQALHAQLNIYKKGIVIKNQINTP
jgi:transcriptional regulator with XRE-family HTH domain